MTVKLARKSVTTRKVYQCCKCRHQVSVTAGTLFHSTNLPLVKWFWAIYLVAADKGGISALRLSKHIGVSWPTARNVLKKIRTAMADRDSMYRLLNDLIELDDAYIGGKKPGKKGRGAKGKKPIVVAVENKGNKAGFVAMEAMEAVSGKNIKGFLDRHVKEGQHVRTDAFPAMNIIDETYQHEKKSDSTSRGFLVVATGSHRHRKSEKVFEWDLSWSYSYISAGIPG